MKSPTSDSEIFDITFLVCVKQSAHKILIQKKLPVPTKYSDGDPGTCKLISVFWFILSKVFLKKS